MRIYKIRILRGNLVNLPALDGGELAYAIDQNQVYIGNGSENKAVGGARVPDADYGDIIVSDSGTVWTIADGVLSLATLADLESERLIGRAAAGSGPADELTLTEALDFVDSANVAEGDILVRGASDWERLDASGIVSGRLQLAHTAGTRVVPNAPIVIQDQQTTGTNGGTATSGSWQTRTLNTVQSNVDSLASLSSNQISLTEGIYLFEVFAPAYDVSFHQCRLNDTTNGTIVYGSSEFNVTNSQSSSRVCAVVTSASGATWQIQHRVQSTRLTLGYGVANSFGGPEIYTQVKITPLIF